MKDKYYTPEIEEFHVGFEFEIEDLGDDGRTRVWRPQVFDGEETRTYFIEELRNDEMRVKYLDKEDIESLGWKFNRAHLEGETQLKFYKDNKCLYYREGEHQIGVFTINPSKCEYYSKHGVDPCMINTVTIKNKSELKRLLKQLGI